MDNTINKLKNGCYNNEIKRIYGCNDSEAENYILRILKTIDGFNKTFESQENFRIFSAPGRTEIGGNHTDHQHGRVLCGSVNLDVIAVVVPDSSDKIQIKSKGYDVDIIDVNDTDVNPLEDNKSISLIRGVAAKFKELGYKIGGFKAYTTSTVLKGSGLSSSAAFEVLVGNIFNSLFAGGKVAPVEIAKIGQYAENTYFGKPCGLMDQMASSVGGVISIDFNDPSVPIIDKIDFNMEGYCLCIIDSNADHADLTDEYAAVPCEMKSVANFFGKDFLREVDKNTFYESIMELRNKVNDRAVLRASHFFEDNERVLSQVNALKSDDIESFKKLVIESGYSSYMYLQNVYASSQPYNQGVAIVLCICERLLKGKGAFRVHGGGFAGTVQAFVPVDMVDDFKQQMEMVVGKNKCHILNIRPVGGTEIV